MARVTVIEEPPPNDGTFGLEHGTALPQRHRGRVITRGEAGPIPGSPARPALPAEMAAKVTDCLARYGAGGGAVPGTAAFLDGLRTLLEPAPQLRLTA